MYKLCVEDRSQANRELIYEGAADWGAVQEADLKYVAEKGGLIAFVGRQYPFLALRQWLLAEVEARVRAAGGS